MDEYQNASEMERMPNGEAEIVNRTPEHGNFESSNPHTGDGASPGKIFIGGLARETTPAQFMKHFGKYGEITDSVIMKDRNTGQPRGFGFVTYADSSVVDRVIEETHIINGKQVEIKRTIPRGAGSKDFKTKKIFVGGIPATVDEDEFKGFFSSFGEVKEQQIMRDHSTGRSRGFGFVTFESEQSVDDILVNGNRIEFAGAQVEIKKAEPKKPNAPPPTSRRPSNSRAPFGGGVGDAYGGGLDRGGSGFGAGSYRSGGGAYGSRASSAYGGYGGASDYGAYGGYGAGGYGGGLRADPSYGYSSRFGGGGFGRGYDIGGEYGGPGDSYAGAYGSGSSTGGYGGGSTGGYGGGSAGGYGGASSGGYGSGGYDGGFGGGYGRGGFGGGYGDRGGYGGRGSGRYHPYGR